MRRVVAVIISAALLPTWVAGESDSAAAPPRASAVKEVQRRYGDGPVRLAPRQSGAVMFSGRRGDRVTLDVRAVGKASAACYGRVTLVDLRGSRRTTLDRVLRLRTSGSMVLTFRGRCGSKSEPLPVRVQLQKVRLHHIQVDGRAERVPAPRRGYVDVAWIRLPSTGRVKLTARDRGGRATQATRILIGSRLDRIHADSVAVEDGQPIVRDSIIRHTTPLDPVLKGGTVVGLVVASRGTVDARTATTHPVTVDGTATTLASDRGREHVLTFAVADGETTYVHTADPTSWKGWDWYALPEEPGTGGSSVRRIVLVSDVDAADSESFDVRIRRVTRTPDLAAGGAPVRFASTDPGQWFVARVPATSSGAVRLSASNVAVSGGGWDVEVPGACWSRDCESTGLYLNEAHLVDDGALLPEPHEVFFRFDPSASGGVTVTLASG